MTHLYITVDAEYEPDFTARQGRRSRHENFARSIECATGDGSVGLAFQLDTLDRHGLKAVFFVDPMPALLWGVGAIEDVVRPIAERGHDAQLHLHTEWLALAGAANPLRGRTGDNLTAFTFDEQCVLIDFAARTLMAAGAPKPRAFRAGNYGANDDTLRALAELGIGYDTSHCPGFPGSACRISLGADDRRPVRHCGVVEVPIGCIGDIRSLRHAQVTALSSDELLAAIGHARDSGVRDFTIVSHSFELLSRDRTKINRIVKHRFERMCEGIARLPGVSTATYAARPPAVVASTRPRPTLPASLTRTARRMAEQAVVNMLYGARAKAVLVPMLAFGAMAD
jgi:hypothetical protein